MACDDGVLRLVGPDEAGPGLQYRRSFGRVEGRVLSAAWHPGGQTLVTGHSDGCIRAWDSATTREIFRITAGMRFRRMLGGNKQVQLFARSSGKGPPRTCHET